MKKYDLHLFLTLVLINIWNQALGEDFYYFQKSKVLIHQEGNDYAVKFCKIDAEENKKMLSTRGLECNLRDLSGSVIRVHSPVSFERTQNILIDPTVNGLGKVYSSELSDKQFSFFNYIIVKFKREISYGAIKTIIEKYGLTNVVKQWYEVE